MAKRGGWYSGFETVSNFRMFYRDWRPAGAETCPPVIALHGSGFQSGLWRLTAEAVGRMRFVCPDQKGYARSEYLGWGDAAEDFARDAIGLADALMVPRFVIMGHSFAGAIALAVAGMIPDRVAAVVLVDPTARDMKERQEHAAQSLARPETFESTAEAVRHFRKTEERNCTVQSARRFIEDVFIHNGDGGSCRVPYSRDRIQKLRAVQGTPEGGFDPIAKARKVKCPVLYLRGGLSNRSTPRMVERLKAALPKGARVVVFKRSGHFPFVTEASLFHKELSAFLAKVR